MSKRIIVSGGGIVSGSRADYISKSRLGESETEERKLFNATETNLSRHAATNFLGDGETPKDGDVAELIFSLERKDFERLGATLEEQKAAMQEVVREGLENLWKELGVKDVRFIAGIHLNTNNPHAHIAFVRDAVDIETGKTRSLPKIPRNWFWRNNDENSKLAKMFENALINRTMATPPDSVLTKANSKLFLPAREFSTERIEKALNHLSEVNHISPHFVEALTDNRSLYVSRQGALVFLRRDVEGNTTGYVYNQGYQPDETKGFFYIGNPKTAARFIIVENPKEALAALELVGHRDLSEVCFVASDKQKAPAAFTEFLRERSNEASVRVIWAIGLNRDGVQETANYEELQIALTENRKDNAPTLEFYSWTPKEGYGKNWSNQLQFRNLPGELNGITRKLLIADAQVTDALDTNLTDEYAERVKATFANVIIENENNEFIVYQKTADGKGVEYGRYQSFAPVETDNFVVPEFSITSLKGEPIPAWGAFTDELEVINEIQEIYASRVETEFLEAVAGESEVLTKDSADAEAASDVVENQPDKNLSYKEITQILKDIPLEDVMPRLGLYLTYDEERREFAYRDNGTLFKIKVNGNLWCDRYDDNRGGRNALNLVMHVNSQSFAEARGFLLDNFGTEYVPQETEEKAILREAGEKPKAIFVMPEPNDDKLASVHHYLTEVRAIDAEIINQMIERGFIFANNFGSPVFVNKDEKGVVKGASWRATKGTKRGDYTGSEKVNAWFYLGDPNSASKFVITESPIEAMSYYQLHRHSTDLSTTAIISTATNSVPLSLVKLLERNAGENAELVIAYNNDSRGQDGALFLLEKIGQFGMLKHKAKFENGLIETTEFSGSVLIDVPKLEDWNEDLKAARDIGRDAEDNENVAEEMESLSRPEIVAPTDEAIQLVELKVPFMEGRFKNLDGSDRVFPEVFETITAFDKYLALEKPLIGSYKTDIELRLSDNSSIVQTFEISDDSPDTLQGLLKEQIGKFEKMKPLESFQDQLEELEENIGGYKYILAQVQKIQKAEEFSFANQETPELNTPDYYEPELIRSIKVTAPQHLQSFGSAEILLARDNPKDTEFHVGFRFRVGETVIEQLPDRNGQKFAQGKQSLSFGHEKLRACVDSYWKEIGKPQFTQAETTFELSEEKFVAYILHKTEVRAREFSVTKFEPSFSIKPELSDNEIKVLRMWRERTSQDQYYRIESVFPGAARDANPTRNLMYKLIGEGLLQTKQDGVHTLVKGWQPLTPAALEQIGKSAFSKILKSSKDVNREKIEKEVNYYANKLKNPRLNSHNRDYFQKKYEFAQNALENLDTEPEKQAAAPDEAQASADAATESATATKEIVFGENPAQDFDLLIANPLKGGYKPVAHRLNIAFLEAYAPDAERSVGFTFNYRNRVVTILDADEKGTLTVNFKDPKANNAGKTQDYLLHNLIAEGILSKEDFQKLISVSRARQEFKEELENKSLHLNYRAKYDAELIYPDSVGFRIESRFTDGDYVLFRNTENGEVFFTKFRVDKNGEQKIYSFDEKEGIGFAGVAEALAHLEKREEFFARRTVIRIGDVIQHPDKEINSTFVYRDINSKNEVLLVDNSLLPTDDKAIILKNATEFEKEFGVVVANESGLREEIQRHPAVNRFYEFTESDGLFASISANDKGFADNLKDFDEAFIKHDTGRFLLKKDLGLPSSVKNEDIDVIGYNRDASVILYRLGANWSIATLRPGEENYSHSKCTDKLNYLKIMEDFLNLHKIANGINTEPVILTNVEKAPWQHTREEYATDHKNIQKFWAGGKDIDRGGIGYHYGILQKNGLKVAYYELSVKYTPENAYTLAFEAHRFIVAEVHAQGKTIPAEVLADYPELTQTDDIKVGTGEETPEIWKLTFSEFDEAVWAGKIDFQMLGIEAENVSALVRSVREIRLTEDEQNINIVEQTLTEVLQKKHKAEVTLAYAQNKDVPQEVLEEYPTLATLKAQKAAENALTLLPSSQQQGRIEKRIARILHAHKLGDEIANAKEFYVILKNDPYMDLHITKEYGTNLIRFTHYYKQNGDMMHDGEMNFRLHKDGRLTLNQVASALYGVPHYGYDRSFANMFSNNLIHQGFEKAQLERPFDDLRQYEESGEETAAKENPQTASAMIEVENLLPEAERTGKALKVIEVSNPSGVTTWLADQFWNGSETVKAQMERDGLKETGRTATIYTNADWTNLEKIDEIASSQLEIKAEEISEQKRFFSEIEREVFFEEFKAAFNDHKVQEIIKIAGNIAKDRAANVSDVTDAKNNFAFLDVQRAEREGFITVEKKFSSPESNRVELSEKGKIVFQYLDKQEFAQNWQPDAEKVALLTAAKEVQAEIDRRFSERNLKNTWTVKPDYETETVEIGRRAESRPDVMDGYPAFSLHEIDANERTWQISIGELTPATSEEPEDFQFVELKDQQHEFEGAISNLYHEYLLPQTNFSVNRIAPEYRHQLALDTEPTGVKKGTISLALEVRELLHEGKNIGNNVAFNKLCEQHFGGTRANGTFTSRDAYDALEMGVNLYLLDNGRNFIARAPQETLRELRELIKRLPTQTDRTEEQQLFQQFSTVPTESYVAFAATGMRLDDVVLEPSAGNAGLAVWSKMLGLETHVNELTDRRAGILRIIGFDSVSRKNAQFLNDTLNQNIKPTCIIMNPPFSATGGRTKNKTAYGAEHITDALLRLENGGRLVAIVGEGMGFDKPTFTNWWAEVMSKYNVRANVGVPGDEYSKYGTNFGNQIIVIDKNGRTPGASLEEQFASVQSGNFNNLEDVLKVLNEIGADRRDPKEFQYNQNVQSESKNEAQTNEFKSIGTDELINFYKNEGGYELKTVTGEIEKITLVNARDGSKDQFLNIYVKNEKSIVYKFAIGNRSIDKPAEQLFNAIKTGTIKKGDNLTLTGYVNQDLEARAIKNLEESPEKVLSGEKFTTTIVYALDVTHTPQSSVQVENVQKTPAEIAAEIYKNSQDSWNRFAEHHYQFAFGNMSNDAFAVANTFGSRTNVEKLLDAKVTIVPTAKTFEKARWDGIGIATGGRVERIEERGYRVIYGEAEGNRRYDIAGIIGPSTDAFINRGLTIEKVRFSNFEVAGHIKRADVKANPHKVFLFGDNLKQTGLGGQAREMRGEPNALGIPTKKEPSNEDWAFFNDKDIDANKEAIDKAFAKLAKYTPDTIIVVPQAGLGTGLADLPNKAPKTFAYLQSKLEGIGFSSKIAETRTLHLSEIKEGDILTSSHKQNVNLGNLSPKVEKEYEVIRVNQRSITVRNVEKEKEFRVDFWEHNDSYGWTLGLNFIQRKDVYAALRENQATELRENVEELNRHFERLESKLRAAGKSVQHSENYAERSIEITDSSTANNKLIGVIHYEDEGLVYLSDGKVSDVIQLSDFAETITKTANIADDNAKKLLTVGSYENLKKIGYEFAYGEKKDGIDAFITHMTESAEAARILENANLTIIPTAQTYKIAREEAAGAIIGRIDRLEERGYRIVFGKADDATREELVGILSGQYADRFLEKKLTIEKVESDPYQQARKGENQIGDTQESVNRQMKDLLEKPFEQRVLEIENPQEEIDLHEVGAIVSRGASGYSEFHKSEMDAVWEETTIAKLVLSEMPVETRDTILRQFDEVVTDVEFVVNDKSYVLSPVNNVGVKEIIEKINHDEAEALSDSADENLIPVIDLQAYTKATAEDRNFIDDAEDNFSPEEVRADYFQETIGLAASVIRLTEAVKTEPTTQKGKIQHKKDVEQLEQNKGDLAFHVRSSGKYFGKASEEYIKRELLEKGIAVKEDYDLIVETKPEAKTETQASLLDLPQQKAETRSGDDKNSLPAVQDAPKPEIEVKTAVEIPPRVRAEGKHKLLLPETIDLKPKEIEVYSQNREKLEEIGFETMPLSGETVAIKTVPDNIKPSEARALFSELIEKPEKIDSYFTDRAKAEEKTEEIEKLLDVGKNAEKRERVANLGVVEYAPAKLKGGQKHPGDIVESASMAAVEPPDITYKPKLAKKIIADGLLSSLQLEAVIYAGQRHELRLPNGARSGIVIGDGTGLGKGRELAGIALDNWNQNRRRVLWLSINYDLVPSTERDLRDLGASDIPLSSLDKHSIHADLNEAVGDAVLFSSYATLIAKGKDGKSRFDQIVEWLGEDGVIMFDEGHLAKNAVADARAQASQRGEAVVELQEGDKSNPNWRIVYSSATGATELRNMGYMVRLGLWGPGTSFPNGFGEFYTTIDKGGIGAMEMVSRDMKAAGMLFSRSLSYRGVDYRQVHHDLTPAQMEIYNLSSRAWSSVVVSFDEALRQTNANGKARAMAYARLWSGQQMFYRQLLTALKVPAVIRETEQVLNSGSEYTDPKTGEKSKVDAQVIIGVIGTGEARTKDQVSKAMQFGLDLDSLDFSPKQILLNVVESAFPTKRYTEKLDPGSGRTIKVPVVDGDGKHVESQQALMMRDALLQELNERVVLPDNPLDQIVNHFGENSVAEITGRKRRIIVDRETGERRYVKRARDGVAMDKASQDEMAAFQDSRKKIAIISQSASTGISLHADKRSNSENFRRVHITLETSWSADVQMQTFGRSHRSNQSTPPEYVLMSTNLGGEKRFLSTIAKRLSSLGALTKGDRDQAGGGDLLQYDFENKYGTEAAKKVVMMLRDNKASMMTMLPPDPQTGEERSGLRMLYTMGLARKNGNAYEVPEELLKNLEVSKFLNRVLMLDVDTQNAVFDAFTSEMEAIIQHDKELGLFDEGVQDIEGENIRFAGEPRVVSTEKVTGAKTIYYQIHADTPTHPVTLQETSDRNQVIKLNGVEMASNQNKGVFYQQTNSKNIIYAEYVSSRADATTGSMRRYYKFARPSGWQSHLLSEDELTQKFVPVKLEQNCTFRDDVQMNVRNWWNQEVANTPKTQVHKYHLIAGAVLPVWQRLSSSSESGNQMSLKTVRIETQDGERVVGVQIPQNHINRVLRDLGVERSFKTPEEIFDAVIETKETIELVGGIKLRPTFLKKNPIIEIMNLSLYQQNEFKNYGAIQEFINFQTKSFVPSDKEKGIEVLSKILERFPAVDTNEKKAEEAQSKSQNGAGFSDKVQEVIEDIAGATGFSEGLLAKLSDKNTPFATRAAALEDKPLSYYWWVMKAEVNEKGQVLLTPAAFEFVRSTYKEAMGISVKNFEGLFNDELVTDRFFETLDRRAKDGGIYAESIASLTKTLANGRDTREDGILVLLTDEKASMHEELHVSSHVASLGKSLEDRHARFDELKQSESYTIAKPILMQKYGTDSDGILVEECFAYCASGDAHEIGLNKQQLKDFTKLWFQSFAERNGTLTKEQFKELTDESREIRDKAYNEIYVQQLRQRLEPEGEGNTIAGESIRELSERDAGRRDNETESEGRGLDQLQIVPTELAQKIKAEELKRRGELNREILNRALDNGETVPKGMLYKPADEAGDVDEETKSDDESIKENLAVQLGNQILIKAEIAELKFRIGEHENESPQEEYYLVVEKNGERETRRTSLAELELERRALAMAEVEGDKKTGILQMIADDEGKTVEEIEQIRFDEAMAKAEQAQAPWIAQIKESRERTSQKLEGDLRQFARRQETLREETETLFEQAGRPQDVKPAIEPEKVWSEQIKAARRGDVQTFTELEEIHRANNIPRPNDVYARLRGMETLTDLKAHQEKKTLLDELSESDEKQKRVVVELRKDGDELVVEKYRVEDSEKKREAFEQKAKEQKQQAQNEWKNARRALFQPISNKINPFSVTQGTLSWFTRPAETLNTHVNPIQIVKHNPGVQVVRAVLGYFDHRGKAKEFDRLAQESLKHAEMLKGSPDAVNSASNMSKAVKDAIGAEETLRADLGKDPFADKELLKTPERALTDAEMREIGETSAKVGDADLLDKFQNLVEGDATLAESIGETAETIAAKNVMAQTRATAASADAIESIKLTEAGTIEVELNAAQFVEAKEMLETSDVAESLHRRIAEEELLQPRLDLQETAEMQELIGGQNEAVDEFIKQQYVQNGDELAKAMQQPMNLTDQSLVNQLSLPPGAADRFAEIQNAEAALDVLQNQAEIATQMNIQLQNGGVNTTVTNPNANLEASEQQFWKNDRLMRESDITEQTASTNRMNAENAEEAMEIEAAEAVEAAETLEGAEVVAVI